MEEGQWMSEEEYVRASLNTEEKEDIETEHSFYISDEKFSISWDQPTNRCNRTHLSQTLEIKTENCENKNF